MFYKHARDYIQLFESLYHNRSLVQVGNFVLTYENVYMGSTVSSGDKSKSYSFIEACRAGNIEQVRQLLPSMSYETINCTDIDGNTGLHLACIQDNYDLVLLILQSEQGRAFCSRAILNKQGLNAYRCAQSERIRLLFVRPTSTENRFIDTEHDVSVFQARQISQTKSDDQQIKVPNDYNHGYTNKENATDAQFVLAISRAPWLLKKMFKLRTELEACEVIRSFIRQTITNDVIYEELMASFDRFIKTKNAHHLLNLYTKQTALCKVLQDRSSALITLLYLYLNTLASRAFGPGETFRGMVFSDHIKYRATIDDYRWAMQNGDYVLETRVFQSTSTDRSVAEFYIDAYRPPDQSSSAILCHYHFPNKCFTALDIEDVSKYPDEKEVLMLPFTLFKVTNIKIISSEYHVISLTNVPVPETSLTVRKVWKKN